MKGAKWRDFSDDEVAQKVRELSEEVFNLRFQLSMGVAKNPSRVREARRDLARAYTIIRERGGVPAAVAAAVAPTPAPARPAKMPRRRAKAPAKAKTAAKTKAKSARAKKAKG
jgi:large subunit ribosomal protein L29